MTVDLFNRRHRKEALPVPSTSFAYQSKLGIWLQTLWVQKKIGARQRTQAPSSVLYSVTFPKTNRINWNDW